MRCKAKRRDGKPCQQWPVKGLQVCRMHGGSSPQSRAKSKRVQEEERARRVALRVTDPIATEPSQALLDLVATAAGEVAYWRGRVETLQEDNPARLTQGLTKVTEGKDRGGVTTLRTVETVMAIEHRMWVDAQERLAKYATAAIRAGIEERRVRIAEGQGELVAGVIRRILDRLDLEEWQRELVPAVVPEELRRLVAS